MKKHESKTIQTTALHERKVYKYIAFCVRSLELSAAVKLHAISLTMIVSLYASPLMHPAWKVLGRRANCMFTQCTSLQFRVLCGNHKYAVLHVFALSYPVIPSWLHECWEWMEKMGITMNRILVAISMMVGEHWLIRMSTRSGLGGTPTETNWMAKTQLFHFLCFSFVKSELSVNPIKSVTRKAFLNPSSLVLPLVPTIIIILW